MKQTNDTLITYDLSSPESYIFITLAHTGRETDKYSVHMDP